MKKILFLLAVLAMLIVGCGPKVTPGASEWCAKGATWNYNSAAQGTANMVIVGKEQFKGETMCHAQYTVDAQEQQFTVDYYFSEDSKNIWMVQATPDGAKNEVQVAGGTS